MVSLVKTLFVLFLFTSCVQAQQTVFVPSCNGNIAHDTAQFTAISATIGSNQATIRLPYKAILAQRCTLNTLVLTQNITVDNSDGSGISIASGQTLTVQGPRVNPIGKQMFFGPGTTVATGIASAFSQQSASDPTAAGSAIFDPSSNKPYFSRTTNNPAEILTAATQVNIAHLEGGVFNVKSYGALCDGVTNDSIAIALTIAPALAAGGGVYVPYGVCVTDSQTFTVPVRFEMGGSLYVNNGQTVTLTKGLDAPSRGQVFRNIGSGLGTVTIQ